MKTYIATVNGREFRVEILDERHVKVNDRVYEVDFVNIGDRPLYSLLASGRSFEANVHAEDDLWHVLLRGRLYAVQVEDERERALRARAGVEGQDKRPLRLKSPMPGLIVEVKVQPGQEVRKGDTLLILESMKMQNEIKAPRDGVIVAVFVENGQSVAQGEALVQLE